MAANLIIQTAYLGDLLLAIPLIKGLKKAAPGPLELVCRKGFGDLMMACGLVDVVHEIDKKNWSTLDAVAKNLRAKPLGLVVSPHQSLRTALFVAKLKAEAKIGFKTAWNFWAFDERIERPMHLPDALRQLSLLSRRSPGLADRISKLQISAHNRAPLFTPADLTEIPDWASMRLERFTSRGTREKRIFLAPGSQWATKRWTRDGFAKVAADYRAAGFEVHIVGSADEKEICSSIAERAPGSVDLSGRTTLVELADRFATGRLLISNDSGLMHLAAVAGLPTVAVFGPTTLELGYRPWQNRALVVESDLTCRPCGKHGHQKCPIGTHACMKEISAETVEATARNLIEIEQSRS